MKHPWILDPDGPPYIPVGNDEIVSLPVRFGREPDRQIRVQIPAGAALAYGQQLIHMALTQNERQVAANAARVRERTNGTGKRRTRT